MTNWTLRITGARAVPLMLLPWLPLQSQATTLAAHTAESRESFTSVSGLREFPDGRVLLADQCERRLVMLSVNLTSAARVGAEGSGPREYVRPQFVLPWLGDSTMVVDTEGQRMVIVDARGSLITTRPFLRTISGFTTSPRVSAADGLGGLYYLGLPARALGRNTVADSAPLIRTRLDRETSDTVAWIHVPVTPTATRRQGTSFAMTRSRPDPFALHDAWGVANDGSVAVIRGEGYRIEWYKDGKLVRRGAPVAATPIPVTAEDSSLTSQECAGNRSTGFGTPGARGGITPPPPPPNAATSTTKPPFLARTVLIDGSGRAWVPRTRAASDPTPVYDLFDVSGARVAQISLPPRASVVGFGRAVVYVARADDDDLLRVSRHALPK